MKALAMLLLAVSCALAPVAGRITEARGAPAADPAVAAREARLAAELRCLVCQNQSIAESNAPLAVDLRARIREQLESGASDREIREFMVARYGDFVLYRPPLRATTLLLWLGPLLLLVTGVWIARRVVAARRAASAPALSAAESARAARLLDGGPDGR